MSKYTNFDLRGFLAEGKKAKQEKIEETAPGFSHDCAAHVVHETYGYGICLDGEHTLVENAEGKHEVTHYDVFFKEGNKTVKNIPVEDLKVLTESHHGHKRKKDEEVVAAEGETVEVSEEDITEGTDILQMVMNEPSLLGYLATYGAGLFAAVKGGLSAMDYCDANPDNKLCKAWKSFSKDFSSAKDTARKTRGYEEGVEENAELTKEEAFKKEIKDILDS
tara:strand:+ start:1115 stop:1777 length:663 start_codon:yes stop_codon:yes gene_type:complete